MLCFIASRSWNQSFEKLGVETQNLADEVDLLPEAYTGAWCPCTSAALHTEPSEVEHNAYCFVFVGKVHEILPWGWCVMALVEAFLHSMDTRSIMRA